MHLWPEEFRECLYPNGSVRDLATLLCEAPFVEHPEIFTFHDRVQTPSVESGDEKWWSLTSNGLFLVKSFYNFLNDGGIRCHALKWFWRRSCLRKINLLNCLVWKNKIISLENLEKRWCNRLPTATCLMCHSENESVDHLFIMCSFTKQVCDYFVKLLLLLDPPQSMLHLWDTWRFLLSLSRRELGDLVVKVCVWNI